METDPLSLNLESVSERSYLKHYKYNIQQQRQKTSAISTAINGIYSEIPACGLIIWLSLDFYTYVKKYNFLIFFR